MGLDSNPLSLVNVYLWLTFKLQIKCIEFEGSSSFIMMFVSYQFEIYLYVYVCVRIKK